jgi:hypothetical protein
MGFNFPDLTAVFVLAAIGLLACGAVAIWGGYHLISALILYIGG